MTKDTDDKWKNFSEGAADLESDKPSNESTDSEKLEPDAEQSSAGAAIDFPSREAFEEQLTAAEQKAELYKEQSLRSKAEMENVRRRAELDVSNARKFGAERLLNDLLPVIDSLTRGLEVPVSESTEAASMREGVQMTLELLNSTLSKHGVQIVDPARGDAFNPPTGL